jgi:hypothetical protein
MMLYVKIPRNDELLCNIVTRVLISLFCFEKNSTKKTIVIVTVHTTIFKETPKSPLKEKIRKGFEIFCSR